jgi:hypothetical protein
MKTDDRLQADKGVYNNNNNNNSSSSRDAAAMGRTRGPMAAAESPREYMYV